MPMRKYGTADELFALLDERQRERDNLNWGGDAGYNAPVQGGYSGHRMSVDPHAPFFPSSPMSLAGMVRGGYSPHCPHCGAAGHCRHRAGGYNHGQLPLTQEPGAGRQFGGPLPMSSPGGQAHEQLRAQGRAALPSLRDGFNDQTRQIERSRALAVAAIRHALGLG